MLTLPTKHSINSSSTDVKRRLTTNFLIKSTWPIMVSFSVTTLMKSSKREAKIFMNTIKSTVYPDTTSEDLAKATTTTCIIWFPSRQNTTMTEQTSRISVPTKPLIVNANVINKKCTLIWWNKPNKSRCIDMAWSWRNITQMSFKKQRKNYTAAKFQIRKS